jgi:hypothetical protein
MDKQGIQAALCESFVCKFGGWDKFGHQPNIRLFEVQKSLVKKRPSVFQIGLTAISEDLLVLVATQYLDT